jgi:hypothetical protein
MTFALLEQLRPESTDIRLIQQRTIKGQVDIEPVAEVVWAYLRATDKWEGLQLSEG